MTEPNLMKRIGATPGKLILIGVLAVVLITVIVGQLPESQDKPELVRKKPTAASKQSTSQKIAKLSQSIEKEKQTKRTGGKQKTISKVHRRTAQRNRSVPPYCRLLQFIVAVGP